MRYGYDLEYAGVRAESLGIYVVRRPDIPAPEYDMEAIVIPGGTACSIRITIGIIP